MTDAAHPSIERLTSLLRGDLASSEADDVLNHVEHCERCRSRCEFVWAEQPQEAEARAPSSSPPQVDEDLVQRIELKVLRRVHQVQIVDSFAGFATHGFFFVFLGLLRPITSLFSTVLVQTSKD